MNRNEFMGMEYQIQIPVVRRVTIYISRSMMIINKSHCINVRIQYMLKIMSIFYLQSY